MTEKYRKERFKERKNGVIHGKWRRRRRTWIKDRKPIKSLTHFRNLSVNGKKKETEGKRKEKHRAVYVIPVRS